MKQNFVYSGWTFFISGVFSLTGQRHISIHIFIYICTHTHIPGTTKFESLQPLMPFNASNLSVLRRHVLHQHVTCQNLLCRGSRFRSSNTQKKDPHLCENSREGRGRRPSPRPITWLGGGHVRRVLHQAGRFLSATTLVCHLD